MKPRHASVATGLALVMLVGSGALGALGCAHPQKRNDWRTPSPPMTCTSDADCHGGSCAIELGASQQGTCSSPGSRGGSSGAPGDGGAPHPGQSPQPGPNVQPSPNDIQI